jgi:hypothetical protein
MASNCLLFKRVMLFKQVPQTSTGTYLYKYKFVVFYYVGRTKNRNSYTYFLPKTAVFPYKRVIVAVFGIALKKVSIGCMLPANSVL